MGLVAFCWPCACGQVLWVWARKSAVTINVLRLVVRWAFNTVSRALFFHSFSITRLSVVLFGLVVLWERGGSVSDTVTPASGHAQLTPATPYTLRCAGFSAEWGGGHYRGSGTTFWVSIYIRVFLTYGPIKRKRRLISVSGALIWLVCKFPFSF